MVLNCEICELELNKLMPGEYFGTDIINSPCGHFYHKRCLQISERSQFGYFPHQPLTCPTCNIVIGAGESLIEISGGPDNQTDLRRSIHWSNPTQINSSVTEQSQLGNKLDPSDLVSRNNSICSLTRRTYLRKKIMELKGLDGGITQGCQVVCFPDLPEEGIIKWLGKINQIIYIGVEFVNPIGNNFPETNGAPPFACKEHHGRLVLRNDLVLASEFYRERKATKVKEEEGQFQPFLLDFESDFEPQTPHYASSDSLLSEFSTKLDDFYDLCSETNSLLETTKSKLNPVLGQSLPGDGISISALLDRTKSFVNEMEQRNLQVEMCKNKSEEFMEYPDILLPSEERRINRTLEELNNLHSSLSVRLTARLSLLTVSLDNCQTIHELLNEKLDWLSGTKSHLRQMDRSLITTETQLTNRLERVESLMIAFRTPDSCDMAEIAGKISEFRKSGGDVRKFDNLMFEFIGMRNQVHEEIQSKLTTLKESSELFRHFSAAVSKFDEWYAEYMLKICETEVMAKGQETYCPNALALEREQKRVEFLDILRTARKLRVSIFDPSVLDDKIQALQTSWRTLIERVYRGRGRKSV